MNEGEATPPTPRAYPEPQPFSERCACVLSRFSHIQLCAILLDCSLPSSSVHGILQKNTGVGCHFLLQGIFQTQGSNPCLLCLLHWQVGSLPLVPHEKLQNQGQGNNKLKLEGTNLILRFCSISGDWLIRIIPWAPA